MKTLTITATNRPDYLRQTLDSLSKNSHLDEYVLFCAVEPVPTPAGKAVLEICQRIDFMKKSVVINPRILGVKDNPYSIQKRVFDLGSEFSVYLEDDVLLSPDAIELCEWYRQKPELHSGLCLNLYNPDESDPSRPAEVVKAQRFSSLDYATTRDQWKKHFEPNWYANRLGWDYSIVDTLKKPGMFNVMPALSRTHHIGLDGGVHYRRAQHDGQYLNNPWKQDEKKETFTTKKEQCMFDIVRKIQDALGSGCEKYTYAVGPQQDVTAGAEFTKPQPSSCSDCTLSLSDMRKIFESLPLRNGERRNLYCCDGKTFRRFANISIANGGYFWTEVSKSVP